MNEEEYDFMNNELINRFEAMIEQKKISYFDAEDFIEIIEFYLDSFDLPYAEIAVNHALEQHPENTEIQVKLLEFYLESDNLKAAFDCIKKLKTICPEDIDFIIAQAKYWSLREQPKKSLEFYFLAIEKGDDDDFIYNCIANEYVFLGNFETAILYFKKALAINIDDNFSFYSCIDCFHEIQNSTDCIEFLKNYIDLKPYSEHAWIALGLEYIVAKKHEEAIEAFDYVIIINQNSGIAYMQKAYCYERLNNYTQAIAVYEETLAFDDTPALALYKIGKAYLKLKKPMKALKAFHESIHKDPQFYKSWAKASEIYEEMGEYKDAQHYIIRSLDLDSENVNNRKRNIYLHVLIGTYEEAILAYDKLLIIEPSNFYNWFGFAELLITMAEYEKSEEILMKSVNFFHRAELYYQLSAVCYYQNKIERGNEYLKIAVDLNKAILKENSEKYPIIEQYKTHLD